MEVGEIYSVAFFNTGSTDYRDFSIYLVNTTKTAFESPADWISVTGSDLVFSGEVAITGKNWTTIYFETPFQYDGSSNVALIVDDNKNSINNAMRCRTFSTDVCQALCIYGSGTNYNPYHPASYMGTMKSEKNQIIFGTSPLMTFTKPINAYTADGGYYLIAVPFEEINPDEVEDMLANVYDLYQYGEAEREWLNYNTEPFNLEAGKGYLYANSDTLMLNFSGTPYNGDGSVILHKTGDGATAGWNLVGNPFNERAYIDREFYVMSEDGSEIVLAQRDYIMPLEGVFVIADQDGETLTFSTTPLSKSNKHGNVSPSHGILMKIKSFKEQ